MYRIDYRNPLTTVYQYEYALYLYTAQMFRKVVCRSSAIRTLELYYADLVKDTETGQPSYEKQYLLEEKCESLVERDVAGQTGIPAMHEKTAELTVIRTGAGAHIFLYRCGQYAFTVRVKTDKKGRVCGIELRRGTCSARELDILPRLKPWDSNGLTPRGVV